MNAVTRSIYSQNRGPKKKTNARSDLTNHSSIIDNICDGISPRSDDYDGANVDEYQFNVRTSHGDLNSQSILNSLSNSGDMVFSRGDGLQNYQNHSSENANKRQMFDSK